MRFTQLILSLFFCILFSFEDAERPFKEITTELYSFSIPSDWKPGPGMKGDGSIYNKRDSRDYNQCNLFWMSSDVNNFSELVGLIIETYKKKDGTDILIKDIEELTMKGLELDKNVTILEKTSLKTKKANQKRFILTIMEPEVSLGRSKEIKTRIIYLFQKDDKMVHRIEVHLSDNKYQSVGLQEILRIIDSFKLKAKGKP